MPNKNGTGPTGKGALTGRGLGLCREVNQRFKRNFCARRFNSEDSLELTKEQKKKILEEENKIDKKLKELEE